MDIRRVLQVQAIAFALYGLGFFFIPDVINDAVFGWEDTEPIFGRIIGGSFIALAWIEWRLIPDVDGRLDDVWPFVLIPATFVVAFLWERIADTYTGSEGWWWVSFVVSLTFALAVGGSRMRAERA